MADELDISRRGNSEFAGRLCDHEGCSVYARYEVVAPQSQEARLSCGSHLGEMVRAVWTFAKTAAVIKEVPGAWRGRD